jgi:phosphohistidine phosphatase SixA
VSDKPQMILVMRHAERPDDPDNPDLTAAGEQRAEKLATYIPETFDKPDFIFAAAVSRHSDRPYETVKPLSKASGAGIDATFADNDYGALAKELRTKSKYVGKRIVVCWHHGNIPSLLRALKAADGSYPDPWDHKVFNLILKVEFPSGGVSVGKVIEPF